MKNVVRIIVCFLVVAVFSFSSSDAFAEPKYGPLRSKMESDIKARGGKKMDSKGIQKMRERIRKSMKENLGIHKTNFKLPVKGVAVIFGEKKSSLEDYTKFMKEFKSCICTVSPGALNFDGAVPVSCQCTVDDVEIKNVKR